MAHTAKLAFHDLDRTLHLPNKSIDLDWGAHDRGLQHQTVTAKHAMSEANTAHLREALNCCQQAVLS